jgi:pyruvate kinase
VAFTHGGDAARRMSRLRSPIPLLAFTPIRATRNQLGLSWGTEAFLTPMVSHTDDMVRQVDQALLELERCEKGDIVIITAGTPPATSGTTNTMRVHRIGDPTEADEEV